MRSLFYVWKYNILVFRERSCIPIRQFKVDLYVQGTVVQNVITLIKWLAKYVLKISDMGNKYVSVNSYLSKSQ